MYLFDFLSRTLRKANIPTFIYLVINVLIIAGAVSYLFELPFYLAVPIGIGIYMVSLLIALSPIGEWILRIQTSCKPIKRLEQKERLEPLFTEVYKNAQNLDSTISNNVKVYISTDKTPNAFATGRKTICVTEGMLEMPKAQIKAALGHEFGHLAHKDTDLILLVSVGNLVVTALIIGLRFILDLAFFTAKIIVQGVSLLMCFLFAPLAILTEFITNGILKLYHLFITVIIIGLTWLWTNLGIFLVMKSRRDNEYEADDFSYKLGYGDDLCCLLDSLDTTEAKGLFASLSSNHPAKNDRIAKLQEKGVAYRKKYVDD